jgi:hypothetical protein
LARSSPTTVLLLLVLLFFSSPLACCWMMVDDTTSLGRDRFDRMAAKNYYLDYYFPSTSTYNNRHAHSRFRRVLQWEINDKWDKHHCCQQQKRVVSVRAPLCLQTARTHSPVQSSLTLL